MDSNEDEHLLQLIFKNTWSVCLNGGDFFLMFITSSHVEAQSLPKKKARKPPQS